jgi:hypothetical protein
MILPLVQRQYATKPVKLTPDICANQYAGNDWVKTSALFSGLSEYDHTSDLVT